VAAVSGDQHTRADAFVVPALGALWKWHMGRPAVETIDVSLGSSKMGKQQPR
jgi:hypothetical protein